MNIIRHDGFPINKHTSHNSKIDSQKGESKDSRMPANFSNWEFGFIKRVDKGRIITVKDLER